MEKDIKYIILKLTRDIAVDSSVPINLFIKFVNGKRKHNSTIKLKSTRFFYPMKCVVTYEE